MQRVIVLRLIQIGPMLFAVSIVLFFALQLVPGGPTAAWAHGATTSEAIQAIRLKLGLDDPVPVQYIRWLTAALQGDLGYSYTTNLPVVGEVLRHLPPTLLLMGTALTIIVILGVLLGTFQAIRQYSKADTVVTAFAFAGASMPTYWVAMMLLIVNAAIINPITGRPFFPSGGMTNPRGGGGLLDIALHMVLPVTALVLGWVSWYSRYMRSSMLDVIHADYVRTARAKGVPERVVVFKHAFRNAAMPLVTLLALDLPYLFAGALFTELIFGWPGLGYYYYMAITQRDYPVVMGMTIIVAVLVVLASLVADLGYAWLDPRVRYEKGR